MKRFFFVIVLFASALMALADEVSRVDAQQIAQQFFADRGIETATTESRSIRRAVTVTAEAEPFYVFNAGNDQGYVIVSGNSLTEQILGYTDSGTFDEDNLPDNMRAWLQNYADEIAWVEANSDLVKASLADTESASTSANGQRRAASIARHSVEPLLISEWGQRSPYNNYCPTFTTTLGASVTAPVGCVATALSQIMYYYKYPAATIAEIPAMESYGLEAIPAGTVIDWDNILGTYEDVDATDEQMDAVAKLCLMVGQGCEMNYSASSSGTSYIDGINSLVNHFGYRDCAYFADRVNFSTSEWLDMLYGELESGHPVPYCGWSSTGSSGHAFVIDGYDGDEFFHVDWGWFGSSNGYYRITSLLPGDYEGDVDYQTTGYAYSQKILMYMRPEGDEVTTETPQLTITECGVTDNVLTVTIFNYTAPVHSGEVALFVEDSNGEKVQVSDSVTVSDVELYACQWPTFALENIFTEKGEYCVTPGIRTEGSNTWYYYYDLTDDYLYVVVDDDQNVTSEIVEGISGLEVVSVDILGGLVKYKQDVLITIANNSLEHISGEIKLILETIDGEEVSSEVIMVAIDANDTYTALKSFTPYLTNYNVKFTYKGTTLYTTQLTFVSSISDIDRNLQISDVTISNLYGTRMVGSAVVTNLGDDEISIEINIVIKYLSAAGKTYALKSTTLTLIDLVAGGSQTIDFEFSDLSYDTAYIIAFRYMPDYEEIPGGESDWSNPYYMKEGTLYWSNYGVMKGKVNSTSLSPRASWTAVLFSGASSTTVKPPYNINILYMFEDADVSSGLDGYNVVVDGVAEEINLVNDYAFYVPDAFTTDKATFTVHYSSYASDGSNYWRPLTLPFKPTSVTIDGEDAYWTQNGEIGDFWLLEPTAEDDDYGLVFEDVDGIESLRANQPYMIAIPEAMLGKDIVFSAEDVYFLATEDIKSTVSTDSFKIYSSTYYQEPPSTGAYLYNTYNNYYYYATIVPIDPFTHYVTTSLSRTEVPLVPATMKTTAITSDDSGYDDETTGVRIYNVSTDVADTQMYNLAGQRINPAMTSVRNKGIYIMNGRKILK